MPELVRNNLDLELFAREANEAPRKSKERYLVMALTSLLAINLVVIFGAITFYYLLVQR